MFRIRSSVLDFLDSTTANQPFFLNIGYIATHSPYGQQYHDLSLTMRYQDATFADIPPYVPHPWVNNEDGPGDPPPSESIRDRYIGYYASVSEIDHNVGRVLAKLKEMGQLENTLVIYTSDHGCALGHQGFWGKGNSTRPLNMYETSLRVPLLWRGPGVAHGQVIGRCVDHYDGFETLADIAGVELDEPRRCPGTSYRALLAGKTPDWDDTVFGEYGDLRMIRTPAWKLIWRYPDGPHKLFDLEGDPDETSNMVEQPDLQPVVAELKDRIDGFYAVYETPEKSGLRVKEQHRHNIDSEAWRDGRREARGLQLT